MDPKKPGAIQVKYHKINFKSLQYDQADTVRFTVGAVVAIYTP